MKTKSILLAATGALLFTGMLAETAQANVVLGQEYDATLYLLGSASGPSFVEGSSAKLIVSGTAGPGQQSDSTPGMTSADDGQYFYQYYFGNYGEGHNSTTPADALFSLAVYFSTAGANVTDINTNPGGTGTGVLDPDGQEVNWNFSPLTTMDDVNFVSPIPPTLGYTTAHDGGNWEAVGGADAFGVVVPNVPDGGTTVFLLGGALLGLGALRRKLA